jgi:hypothetical protein
MLRDLPSQHTETLFPLVLVFLDIHLLMMPTFYIIRLYLIKTHWRIFKNKPTKCWDIIINSSRI